VGCPGEDVLTELPWTQWLTLTALATAGWAVALHLWFLPVYLILLSMTPAMDAAHRRWVRS